MLEIELFEQLYENKWLLFKWIVSDTLKYLEPFYYMPMRE